MIKTTQMMMDYNQRTLGHLSYAAMLGDFMTAFGHLPPPGETIVPPDAFVLSKKLVDEELEEYADAWLKFSESQSLENATELLDGIVDSIYVLLWTAVRFNLPVHAAFLEVHRSNMAKLQPDGTVIKNAFGKVVKPTGWTAPNLFELMATHRDVSNWRAGMQQNG